MEHLFKTQISESMQHASPHPWPPIVECQHPGQVAKHLLEQAWPFRRVDHFHQRPLSITVNGLQPNSDGLQPGNLVAMASNLGLQPNMGGGLSIKSIETLSRPGVLSVPS